MSDPWKLVDYTNDKKTGGYLTITFNDVRVADVFPYAKSADPIWVEKHARLIVEIMNRVDSFNSDMLEDKETK